MSGRTVRWGYLGVVLGLLLAMAPAGQALTLPSGDEPVTVEFQLGAWFALRPGGEGLVSGGTVIGTPFDLQRDFHLDNKALVDLRAMMHLGPHSWLRLGYTQLDMTGSRFLGGALQFNGSYFDSGALIDSRLKQDLFKLSWGVQFIGDSDGILQFGPIFALHQYHARIEVATRDKAASTDLDVNNFTPAFGLALDFNPHRVVKVFMESSGMHQSAKGWHLDSEAGVKVYPIRELGIVLSYRRLDVEWRDRNSEDRVRWTVEGIYGGFNLRF